MYYYRKRAEDFDEEHLQSFAKALVDVPLGGSTTRSAILPPLTQEYGLDEAKELFRRAEEKWDHCIGGIRALCCSDPLNA